MPSNFFITKNAILNLDKIITASYQDGERDISFLLDGDENGFKWRYDSPEIAKEVWLSLQEHVSKK